MKNHLVSDNNCNAVNVYCPIFWQGMTNNVRFAFSVGDTLGAVHNKYWARQNKIGDTI